MLFGLETGRRVMSHGASTTKRSGGKVCKTHSTCTRVVGKLVDEAERCPSISRIRLGYISAGIGSAHGLCRAKILPEPGALLLKIRDHTFHQEVWIYVLNQRDAKEWLVRCLTKLGLKICCSDDATS